MTRTSTQQPEALRLAHTLSGGKLIDDSMEWADTLHAAAEELRRLHARITELEAKLAATLTTAVAQTTAAAVARTKRKKEEMITQAIDTAKSLQRVKNYLEHFEQGKGYCKECIHTFIDKGGDEIPLLVADLKVLLQQVTITSSNTDARDAARYRWLRDNDWRNDEKMDPVIRLHLNAIWDEKIDAAMAEAKAKKKGNKQ